MHAEPASSPLFDLTCCPSWPGRLFGTAPLYLQDTHLVFHHQRQPQQLALSALTALPQLRKRLTGHYWVLRTATQTWMLGPYQPAQLTPIHEAVTQFLLSQAQPRITAAYQKFVMQARHNYLQDTHLSSLTEELSLISSLYAPLLDTHLSLPPVCVKQLHALRAVSPLTEFADRLRAQFEHEELRRYASLFDQVEAHPLTHAQRLAVVRNDTHNLVLAAAGTGKTSVIVARVLYLVVSQRAQGNEIVVLAYNNAAASELRQRLEARARVARVDIARLPKILTFHALARQLLAQNGAVKEISPMTVKREQLEQWAHQWWGDYVGASAAQLKQFVNAMSLPADPFSFDSAASLEAHHRDAQYRTLQGERVASYPLWQLANLLFLNGIAYRYRPRLPAQPGGLAQPYRPDFALADSGVLLDYLPVNDQGAMPPGYDSNAFAQHQQALAKHFITQDIHLRQVQGAHSDSHPAAPQRLRCFHADFAQPAAEQALLAVLTRLGQPPCPPPLSHLHHTVCSSSGFGESIKRYLACLAAIRTEQLDTHQLEARIFQHFGAVSADFVPLLAAFCQAYAQRLQDDGQHDFDDMIRQATCELYQPQPYRYVLVDEFQDISSARLALLRALRHHSPAPVLTAVGDDWQAIYRFSGGNLQLTTQFARHIGPHSTTLLDKTFRYNNSVAHTAGQFVMQNPAQFQKTIDTHQHLTRSQVFLLDDMPEQRPDPAHRACQVITQIRRRDPDAHIAVLARYHFHLSAVRQLLRQDGVEAVSTWTLHSAKGLEADYVVIIGLDNGPLGFPSAARQDRLTEALLPAAENYPFAEERRLLYVAITRARQKCYLIANPLKPSVFIEELLNPAFAVEIVSERFHTQFRKAYKCPQCVYGYYLPDSYRRPAHYSCSSAPACTEKVAACPQCAAPATGTHSADCQSTKVIAT